MNTNSNNKFGGPKANQYKNNIATLDNTEATTPLVSTDNKYNKQLLNPVTVEQNPTTESISIQIDRIKNNLSTTRIFLVFLILLYLAIVGYLIFYVNSNSNKFNTIQGEFQKAFDELNQMLNVLQMREAQITAAINNYISTSSPS